MRGMQAQGRREAGRELGRGESEAGSYDPRSALSSTKILWHAGCNREWWQARRKLNRDPAATPP